MKQTYNQYLKSRIEFSFLVGLWMEYDVESSVVFEQPSDGDLASGKVLIHGDLAIPCMSLAKLVKQNPRMIADRLKSYVEQSNGIEKVDSVAGYLNIFFDRVAYLRSAI